jgi:enamine deaminase RidA (YjgF/YER057c/UK114 family)
MQILRPKGWPAPLGYSYGVASRGRQVFVAGLVGWDAEGRISAADFAGQAKQALKNVVAVLAEAGALPGHITRMTWYVTDRREYLAASRALGAAYREVMGRHYPAMAAVEVKGLMDEHAKVEIEVTAVVPDATP